MARTERVENLVLGGGEAGKYVAWELAKLGRPVVVVERELVGGSCPNVACLPSKNVIRSAEVAHLARMAGAYTALRDAILTHPTMAEGLTVLLTDVPAHAGGAN